MDTIKVMDERIAKLVNVQYGAKSERLKKRSKITAMEVVEMPKLEKDKAHLLRIEDLTLIRYIPRRFIKEVYRNHIYALKEEIISGEMPQIRTLNR